MRDKTKSSCRSSPIPIVSALAYPHERWDAEPRKHGCCGCSVFPEVHEHLSWSQPKGLSRYNHIALSAELKEAAGDHGEGIQVPQNCSFFFYTDHACDFQTRELKYLKLQIQILGLACLLSNSSTKYYLLKNPVLSCFCLSCRLFLPSCFYIFCLLFVVRDMPPASCIRHYFLGRNTASGCTLNLNALWLLTLQYFSQKNLVVSKFIKDLDSFRTTHLNPT